MVDKKRFPGVLWLLPILFGIIGGVVASLIASLKYEATWWPLFVVGLAISFLWSIPWFVVSCLIAGINWS